MSGTTPEFEHDCSTCVFLGGFTYQGLYADLYVCPNSLIPTVIARHSSDGPDYSSGLSFSYYARTETSSGTRIMRNEFLAEARWRAEEHGFLPRRYQSEDEEWFAAEKKGSAWFK